MGWTFSNWTRAELIEHLTQPGETDTARYETLRFAIRGDVLWQVIRYTSKEPAVIEMVADHSFTIIGCTLLERSSGWWGYKAMVEQAHPYYYSCPLKYLAIPTMMRSIRQTRRRWSRPSLVRPARHRKPNRRSTLPALPRHRHRPASISWSGCAAVSKLARSSSTTRRPAFIPSRIRSCW